MNAARALALLASVAAALALARACICTTDYDPVCCLVSGKPVTKSNACFCRCAGGSVAAKGECQVAARAAAEPSCACTEQYDPVCCKLGKRLFTASNECFCNGCGRGGTVVASGPCNKDTCVRQCPTTVQSVCCSIGGASSTEPSTCACECKDGRRVNFGPCKTAERIVARIDRCTQNCPINVQGACCKLNGNPTVVASKCVCKCKGGIFLNEGKCNDGDATS